MKKIYILAGVVVVLLIVLFANKSEVAQPTPESITFSKTGVFVMNNPGMEKDVPFLIYEEPGKPAISAKLKFDEKSICTSESGTLPCMAMSISFDLAFGGKRVLVEGVDGEGGFIVIRKIQIQNENNILPFDSGVEGVVTLGPTCPVMREPPDPQCADKPYATTIQIIASGSPKSSLFATVESGKDGKYKIMLPPGEYALQPVGGAVLPRCETKNVTIESSKIAKADLSCDTGIR